nr:MAG TPA: hypothetical protein [Caudoviricetes sp.]
MCKLLSQAALVVKNCFILCITIISRITSRK